MFASNLYVKKDSAMLSNCTFAQRSIAIGLVVFIGVFVAAVVVVVVTVCRSCPYQGPQ